jgi:hypothetical protein
MGPNRRAQERERAAALAAEAAKRAEAERKAAFEARKIVDIWNARQAGGRALVLPYDRRRYRRWISMAHVLMPSVPSIWFSGPPHDRPPSRRIDLQPDPFAIVSAVFPTPAVCQARNADSGTTSGL